MKVSTSLLSTLALMTSATQAALTTSNVTYDLFTVELYNAFGSLADVVVAQESSWLSTTFDTMFSDVVTQIELGQEAYPYYEAQLTEFFETAADYNASYDSLSEEYNAYDLPFAAVLDFAAGPYFDMFFDTVESVLPTLKNSTLSEWHNHERQAIEKLVLNGTHGDVLEEKLDEYLWTLFENDAAATSFTDAADELYERTQEEYEVPVDEEEDDEDDEEDAGDDQ